jgi:hypothetical protein
VFHPDERSKDLVGKCAVFRERGAWIYASYVIRVRIKDQKAYLPEFLARFLNSDVGRVQIDRLSRQALMTNINSEEIKELMVPHPDPDVQKAMVDDLNGHWQRYRECMASVRDLLTQGDREITQRLGLEPPPSTNPLSWAVRRGGLVTGDRLNSEFFHPERVLTARAILDGEHPAHPLDQVVTFVRAKQRASSRRISTSDWRTSNETPENCCPALTSTHWICRRARSSSSRPVTSCSASCVRISTRSTSPMWTVSARPNFSCSVPTTVSGANTSRPSCAPRLTLTQTKHMAGGNTHPRLTPTDVHAMYIPVPDDSTIQDAIADAEAENRIEARRVKAQADDDWTGAKQRFGDDLVK